MALPRRRKLQRFLGLSRSVPDIGIYASLLRVERATGAEAVKVGFTGAGLIRSEYIAACGLRDSLVERAVTRGPISGRIRWRLNIVIDASPRTPLSEPLLYKNQTLILLGSKVHNALTEKYFDLNPKSIFIWVRNGAGQRAFQLRQRPDREFPGRRATNAGESSLTVRTNQQAIIERHFDKEYKRWVLIIAGVGALATAGATKFLLENWEQLDRLTKAKKLDQEFGVLLLFENCLHDLDLEHDISDIPEPRILAVADQYGVTEPLDAQSSYQLASVAFRR